MKDTIYREDAVDAFVKFSHLDWEYLKIMNPVLTVLESLPPAEPERMRGRWEKVFLDNTSCPIVKCSCCGQEYFARALKYNFCPNCGADMRGH